MKALAGIVPETDARWQLPEPSLRKNFLWSFTGNVVYTLCQWGMLVVLAKLGTPAMVGIYALGLSVTAPILLFFNLNLRTAQATDAKLAYPFADYLGLRLVTTCLAMILIAIIALGVYGTNRGVIILLVGIAKGCEAISDVFHGLLQQHERMDRISISLMLKGLLSLVVFAGGIWISNNLIVGVIGLVLVWAALLLSYDVRSGQIILGDTTLAQIAPRWRLPALRELVVLTLPLGLSAMLVSLVANIPRYFVERREGPEGLGIFVAMVYIMQAGGVVINALAQAATPRLAKLYAQTNVRGFISLLGILLLVGIVLGVGCVLVAVVDGAGILTWLYRAEYAARIDVFMWVMVATGLSFLASFLGYSLSATRHFQIQPLIFAIEVLLTGVVCLALVPPFGVLGAAWAMCVTMAFQVAAMAAANLYALGSLRGRRSSDNVTG